MSKLKNSFSLALLAAIPLTYHRLYKKTYGNRESSDRVKPLPHVDLPGNDFYLTEEDFKTQMNETVLPYLAQRETIQGFETTHRINYAFYRADDPSANLVISHGYAEDIERYAEAVYYFLNMGYNVYLPEHFGHGDSDAGVDDPTLIWVDDFDTYSFDLYRFIKDVVQNREPDMPVIVYSHSMGGAIAARALELYPDLCTAAILSSPMLQVRLFQAESLIFPLTQAISKTPFSRSFIPGETRFQKHLPDDFQLEKAATHSQARGDFFHRRRWSELKNSRYAVSFGWISESLKAGHEIVRQKEVEKITVPLLMFQSETDWFVDAKGMYEFAEYAKDLEFYHVPGSLHEIYSETDDIIVPYFNKIDQFIKNVLNQRALEAQEKMIPGGF